METYQVFQYCYLFRIFFYFMKRLASRKKPTGMKAFFFSLFGTYKACFFVLGRVASLCRAFVLFFFRVGAIRFHGQIALTPARSGCPTDLSSVPAAQVIKNRLLCFYSLHDYLWWFFLRLFSKDVGICIGALGGFCCASLLTDLFALFFFPGVCVFCVLLEHFFPCVLWLQRASISLAMSIRLRFFL